VDRGTSEYSHKGERTINIKVMDEEAQNNLIIMKMAQHTAERKICQKSLMR
jgi:hypothetical protein